MTLVLSEISTHSTICNKEIRIHSTTHRFIPERLPQLAGLLGNLPDGGSRVVAVDALPGGVHPDHVRARRPLGLTRQFDQLLPPLPLLSLRNLLLLLLALLSLLGRRRRPLESIV